MTTRRTFVRRVSVGVLTAAAARAGLSHASEAQTTLKHPASGVVGLQLYSLRHLFEKGNIAQTLALVRRWGFSDVEAAGTYGLSPADFTTQVKQAGLRIASTGADFEALVKDVGAVIKVAQQLGAEQVMCAWIPHEKRFSRADVDKAVPVFMKAGRAMRDAGLRFLYHTHGYEFQESADGTLFDALAKGTEAGIVDFQMDVFWVVHGGGSPVELFTKYPNRFPSTHLKDIRKGTKLCDPTGNAPDDTSVVLGDGMVDIAGILRTANKSGVKYHFIEDEHPESEKQIPRSLEYLASLRV
ncbi:MAG TPA: sugar phosphate isomerase/epimerase [Vicinamibacterales bacterium]|nr:sugar phosphate isomerase/epimerase [Vicinamibacterales bacterium]